VTGLPFASTKKSVYAHRQRERQLLRRSWIARDSFAVLAEEYPVSIAAGIRIGGLQADLLRDVLLPVSMLEGER